MFGQTGLRGIMLYMRLLLLGGTRFVGPAVVTAALAKGWEVTTFNRAQSGVDHPAVTAIHGDRTASEDVARLADSGPWDVALDLSGFVPRNVLAVCRALDAVVDHYVFVSTVSVYQGWPVEPLSEASPVLDCAPDAGPDFGEDVEDGPTRYGYQKAGCERAVRLLFGAGRSSILRPGVVLGPGEYVGRLPWWLHRIATGGTIVAPGSADRPIQPIDGRDLASFALEVAARRQPGPFNVTAPRDRTFGNLVRHCAEVTGSAPDVVWVPDEDLLALGIRQWSELPLWRVHEGVWSVDSTAAQAEGLVARPLRDTVVDTWVWLNDTAERSEDVRAMDIGLSLQREREIIAAVGRDAVRGSRPHQ